MDMITRKQLLLILFIFLFPYLVVCFVLWDFPFVGDWDITGRLAYLAWQFLFLPLLGILEDL